MNKKTFNELLDQYGGDVIIEILNIESFDMATGALKKQRIFIANSRRTGSGYTGATIETALENLIKYDHE